MTTHRDLVQEFPYEQMMTSMGMTREELDQELNDVLAHLSPEDKELMAWTETWLDEEVPE